MFGNLIEKIGGRKAAMVVLVFLVTVLFTVFQKLTPEEMMSVVQLLLIAYPSGSVIQKALVAKPDSASTTQTEPTKEDSEYATGRKFWLFIFIYLTLVPLVFFNLLPTSVYVTLTQFVVGVYIAGNVTEKIALNGLTLPTVVRK